VFKRFKSGLFYPSEVINYRSDKKITTFLYFLILVILTIIPSIIIILGDSSLEYAEKKVIRESFEGQEILVKIENYKLVTTVPMAEEYQEVKIGSGMRVILTPQTSYFLNTSAFNTDVILILAEEGVYYQRAISHVLLFKYEEYPELQNLDLTLAGEDDFGFWETVFPIIDSRIDDFSGYYNLIYIAALAIASVIGLLFFGLLISLFQKLMLPFVKFSQYFKLMIYLLTPFVVFELLGTLFGLNFLPFIGIILTVVYTSRLNRKLYSK
jgi:hypothetical protein